jgi:purine-nucleoside phosphorylase
MILPAALEILRPLFPLPPQIALILGSGLGDFAKRLRDSRRMDTKNIPDYPRSTVPGHAGAIHSGELAGKRLICFQGRIHLYEGYPVESVVLPVQVAAALGAKILILTNASGGVHRHLTPGSLMLIEDQVDLQFRARKMTVGAQHAVPLPNIRPDLLTEGSPYSSRLIDVAEAAALGLKMKLHRGVLGALTGPSYETPAEVRLWMRIGVDAACMSTAAEAAEGARLGMEVLGISCITNRAAGLSDTPLDHAEVIKVANQVKRQFAKLLTEIIKSCPA